LSLASAAERGFRSAASLSAGIGTGAAFGKALRRPLMRGWDSPFAFPRGARVRLAFTVG
jgi:hypothetical protein